MKRRSSVRLNWRLWGLVLFIVLLIPPESAQSQNPTQRLPFDVYRGRQPVLVVFAQTLQDDRIFEVHLAVMEQWEVLGRLGLEVIDILPGNTSLSAVARRLDIPVDQFAVVLLNREGDVIFRSNESNVVSQIIEVLEQ